MLVLSQYVRPSYAFELLADDARGVGYLLKDRVSDLAELSDAVRRVGEGGSVLDPSVVSQLVGRRRQGHDPIDDLSEREREVLALMAEGRSNRAIAERLFITERTVEKHVKSIFMKLHIRRAPRTTAACWRCWPTSAPRPAYGLATPGEDSRQPDRKTA